MENRIGMALSGATIIAILITISLFILYGANMYFYAAAVISIALGFIETWVISAESRREAEKSRGRSIKRKSSKPKMKGTTESTAHSK